MILLHNVAGMEDVRSVQVKCPYTGWVPMWRNWGALWTVTTQMRGPLSFHITTSNGQSVYAGNAVGKWWRFGQTWEARANFNVYQVAIESNHADLLVSASSDTS